MKSYSCQGFLPLIFASVCRCRVCTVSPAGSYACTDWEPVLSCLLEWHSTHSISTLLTRQTLMRTLLTVLHSRTTGPLIHNIICHSPLVAVMTDINHHRSSWALRLVFMVILCFGIFHRSSYTSTIIDSETPSFKYIHTQPSPTQYKLKEGNSCHV